jgi:hypothetical protein
VEDVDPSTGELSAKEASAEPVSAVENGSQAA